MLHEFLTANRAELIDRCRVKVANRSAPEASGPELEHGVTLFLDQLTTLLPGGTDYPGSGGNTAQRPASSAESNIERGATKHGQELLRHHFTIEQVVRDYGDLCQAITQLAAEKDVPITAQEFGILNIRLDNAIAGAVTEFARPDEGLQAADDRVSKANDRLGALAHEMRNLLNTAILAISAIIGEPLGSMARPAPPWTEA